VTTSVYKLFEAGLFKSHGPYGGLINAKSMHHAVLL